MKTSSFSIGVRLVAAFTVILFIMVAITSIAISRLQSAHHTTRYLIDEKLARQQLASEWLGAVNLNGTRAVSIAKSDSLELSDYFEAELKQGETRILEIGKRMGAQRLDQAEEQLVNAIDSQRSAYQDASAQVFKLKNGGRIPEADQLFSAQMAPRFARYRLAIQQLLDYQTRSAAAISAASADAYSSSLALLVGLGGLSIALSMLLAWRLTRSIVLPLKEAVDLAAGIAQGDLSQDISVKGAAGETGQLLHALSAMKASLVQIVGKVRAGTEAISSSSVEIADGNTALSIRTGEQAASLEETAASMAQLAATVRQNADDASRASDLVGTASGVALRGGSAMSEVIDTMRLIRQSSERIADIVTTIDAIALQTNILALNAAVEAAQAGERGRGFAVVAGEVRMLAQRSATAAREIKQLVGASVQHVETGAALVQQAGITIQDVVASVAQVSSIVSGIAAASHEQSAGVAQANLAIKHIDQATQRNAALVEQAAAASGSLQMEAAALARTVSRFTLTNAAASVAAAPGGRLLVAGTAIG